MSDTAMTPATGIPCPKCGKGKVAVAKTFKRAGHIDRVRRCLDKGCKFRFTTRETVPGQIAGISIRDVLKADRMTAGDTGASGSLHSGEPR